MKRSEYFFESKLRIKKRYQKAKTEKCIKKLEDGTLIIDLEKKKSR